MSRRHLVEQLRREGICERVLEAMAEVPRERFVPEVARELAYVDTPLSIGHGQTISAPSMVGIMCCILDLKEGQKVLEVGTGWGYHAAVMSRLVGSGTIYTVERIPELAAHAKAVLEELGYDNVSVVTGDGSAGWPEHAPYDRISVAAAAPRVPEGLVADLADRGRMVIPVGQYVQELMLVVKEDGKVEATPRGGVAFVPLVGSGGFKGY